MYFFAKQKQTNNMKFFKQLGLFLSSFAPLFLLLILKIIIEIINANWSLNFLNTSLLIILAIALVFGLVELYLTIRQIKSFKGKKVLITKKENTTDQHFLGYFSLFVLFAVSFEIEMYSMAVIFFVVLSLVAIVYIKNDMYYINPVLNIFGYSFYKVDYLENDTTKTANIFFKGPLEVNKEYIMIDKFSNLFFVKSEDKEKK